MPRFARLHAPGVVHHIVARFAGHEFLFDVPGARAKYMSLVPSALRGTGWRALAFALMSSHVHWCFEAGSVPAWVLIQRLHTAFAVWVNRRLARIGPVFAGRYRDLLVLPKAVPLVVAYGHNNPVRAGVALEASDCAWTSHRAYVGVDEPPSWLDVSRGLELCGFGASSTERAAFDTFVAACAGRARDELLSGDAAGRLRRQVRLSCDAPLEITEPCIGASAGQAATRVDVVASPHVPLEILSRPTPAAVIDRVASCVGLRPDSLRSRARVRELVDARRLALAVWVLAIGGRQCSMADALGISTSAASQLLSPCWVRADPRVDAIALTCRSVDGFASEK